MKPIIVIATLGVPATVPHVGVFLILINCTIQRI